MPIDNDTGVSKTAKGATSVPGNLVGGLVGTVGNVTGAATRGVGDTVNNTAGSVGRPVGDTVASTGTGIEGGEERLGKGVENVGQWKKP